MLRKARTLWLHLHSLGFSDRLRHVQQSLPTPFPLLYGGSTSALPSCSVLVLLDADLAAFIASLAAKAHKNGTGFAYLSLPLLFSSPLSLSLSSPLYLLPYLCASLCGHRSNASKLSTST